MKVKVRIAVAVSGNGSWGASGWSLKPGSPPKDDVMMSTAIEMLDTNNWREFWLTAEVDAPDLTPQTVDAEVTEVAP